jgi:hypothetical protein
MPNQTYSFANADVMEQWIADFDSKSKAICDAHHLPEFAERIELRLDSKNLEIEFYIRGTITSGTKEEIVEKEIRNLFNKTWG